MKANAIIFLVAIHFVAEESEAVDIFSGPQPFCYTDDACGPQSKLWPGVCQTGKLQSPIDIVPPSQAESEPMFAHIPMRRFGADHFFLQNNGHTVNVDFSPVGEGSRIFPGFGLSLTRYRFSNAHFHWGPSDEEGSEHRLQGRNFSMEMHLVHFKDRFRTLAEAAKSGDINALAVFAVFFQVTEGSAPNPYLKPVIDLLPSIHETHTFWRRGDTPIDFTPLVRVGYGGTIYSYKGSLTTPECNQIVDWYVVKEPIRISESDVAAFRHVVDGREKELQHNFRPTQPLNGRQINVITVT